MDNSDASDNDPSVRRTTAPCRPRTGTRRPISLEDLLPLENFSAINIHNNAGNSKQVTFGQESIIQFSDDKSEEQRSSVVGGAMAMDIEDNHSLSRGSQFLENSYPLRIMNSKTLALGELKSSCNQLTLDDLKGVVKCSKSTSKCVADLASQSSSSSGPVASLYQEKEKQEAAQRKKYGKAFKDMKEREGPLTLTVTTKDKEKHTLKGHKQVVNSSQGVYYVLSQAPDGDFTAHPVKDWYQFEPSLKYKPLTSEEADEEYDRRNNVINYFSVMVKKRLQGVDPEDVEGKKLSKTSLTLDGDSEPWIDSDESECSDGEHVKENSGLKKSKKSRRKKSTKHQRKLKVGTGEEEEGDDNEFNSRNAGGTPYGSCEEESLSESEGEEEKISYQQGVDEEAGLKDLLKWESDSSDEEQEEGQKVKTENLEENATDDKTKAEKRKKIRGSRKHNPENKATKSGPSSPKIKASSSHDPNKIDSKKSRIESNAVDITEDSQNKCRIVKGTQGTWNIKRVAEDTISESTSPKKSKSEVSKVLLQRAENAGITRETVKRYLVRKPMSIAELYQKFRSKCGQLLKEDLTAAIAYHLKELNPAKLTVNQKMLLYIPTEADHNSLYLSMIDSSKKSPTLKKSP